MNQSQTTDCRIRNIRQGSGTTSSPYFEVYWCETHNKLRGQCDGSTPKD